MRMLNEQILTRATLYKVIMLIVLAAIMVLAPEQAAFAGGEDWSG
jgi:hypothetical protein